MSTRVDFILGLGSRYSYLAATQIGRLADDTGAEIVWMPVNAASLITAAHDGRSPFSGTLTGQYDPGYRDRDAQAWAEIYGVPYVTPPQSGLALDNMALTAWCFEDDETRAEVCMAIFHELYVEGNEVGPARLEAIAARNGLNGDAYADALGIAAGRHAAAVSLALESGVFGVPSFLLGDEMIWGNDRLILLHHRLMQEAMAAS